MVNEQLASPVKPISRESAIRKIQAIARANNTQKLSDKLVLESSYVLTKEFLTEEFGSVKNGIRAAGLYPQRPDKIDLVRSLIEFYENYGYSPRMIDAANGLLMYSIQPYLTAFGTWNNALAAAGLEANKPASGGHNKTSTYAEEEVTLMIQALIDDYGQIGILPPRREHDARKPKYTARQYRRRIGNWSKVAEVAHLRLARISAAHTK